MRHISRTTRKCGRTYVPGVERLINRGQQGDLGEASALEWFTRAGATVCLPVGRSPDYDLVVDLGKGPLRIQVKTSVSRTATPNGHERYEVQLATLGGNRSWSGLVKVFDVTRADFVFILVGNGRRWLIPTCEIDASTAIHVGGPKYSEYEIDGTQSIEDLVLGSTPRVVDCAINRGSVGAGEPSETVNLVPSAEWVRIPPPPFAHAPEAVDGD